MSRLQAGEASPSFAQTGASFALESDDDDLRSAIGGAPSDVFELTPHSSPPSNSRFGRRQSFSDDDDDDHGDGESEIEELWSADEEMLERQRGEDRRGRGRSVSSVASYQLYTPDEEGRVRRKFDRRLTLFVAFLYMLSFLDRSNIGNARIAGMDTDLQPTPPDPSLYEWSLTAFYIAYIAFEWMSILWKMIPAHIFVSLVVLAWGLTASLQAVATSYPMLIALRVVLGIGEAGFTGIPFYLSFFYKRGELAFRVALFISAAPLATTFASALAYLIVQLGELTPIAPWRLLFLIEGFPSVLASVMAWSILPDSPQTASYLTKRERKVAVIRLRNETTSMSTYSSLSSSAAAQDGQEKPSSGIKGGDLLRVLIDPVAWITAAMFFLTNMAYSSLPVFLPKIMTEMGHDAAMAQLLSAPPYLVAFFTVLLTAHLSDRWNMRTIPLLFHALISMAGYAVLAIAESVDLDPTLRYIAIYPAAAGFFNVVTLIITWNINNQATSTRQSGGFAILQLVGQCGPLLGTRLYPDADAPWYTPGMTTCAWAMLAVSGLALALRVYLQLWNRRLDRAEGEKRDEGYEMEEEGLVGPGKRRAPVQSFRYML